jgi:hypothetical protein
MVVVRAQGRRVTGRASCRSKSLCRS